MPNASEAARHIGEVEGQRCLALAESRDPAFAERAYQFIVNHIREQAKPVSGESATLACVAAGIQPHDDRAFGPVYARAIRAGEIQVVGFTSRRRGHGTAGGRLYAAGYGKQKEQAQ